MLPTTAIAQSGLNAAQQRLHAAAHNIANAQTTDYRRVEIESVELAGGGVGTQTRRANTGQSTAVPLVADLIAARRASYDFKANLKVIRAVDTMIGSLLDDRA